MFAKSRPHPLQDGEREREKDIFLGERKREREDTKVLYLLL